MDTTVSDPNMVGMIVYTPVMNGETRIWIFRSIHLGTFKKMVSHKISPNV